MRPTAEEAAQALRDIALIKHRAAGFQDYQAESGQLILWGAGEEVPAVAWRYLAVIAAILLFCLALNIIFWPLTPEQGAMLAPMLLSVLYILRGIQLRPRYMIIGLVLGALCLGGYVFLLPVFWPWMILACGGTLILSGLWLRRL